MKSAGLTGLRRVALALGFAALVATSAAAFSVNLSNDRGN